MRRMSIVKFTQTVLSNLIGYRCYSKPCSNRLTISPNGRIMSRFKLTVLFGLAAVVSVPVHAHKDAEGASADRNAIEIVTTAFGLEQLTHYSANQNALGVAWAEYFGMEASYFDLGSSKYSKRRVGSGDPSENVGGRIDLKLALDFTARVSGRSRLFSRFGVYLWDVDVNYNRTTNQLDASRGGNSGMVGVGAAYGEEAMRVSVELEQINAASTADSRDQQRLLLNVMSKF